MERYQNIELFRIGNLKANLNNISFEDNIFEKDDLTKIWKYIYFSIWSGNTNDLNAKLEKYGVVLKAAIFEGMTPWFETLSSIDHQFDFESVNPNTFETSNIKE